MMTYVGPVLVLKSNQVFVFGSNLEGFHGGGAAGYASFGTRDNVWRVVGYQNKPMGWKGKWNVKGFAEGFQVGTEGMSYAIPTVTRPGARLSIPKETIVQSIIRFYAFALMHPDLDFLVAYMYDGTIPLNGYRIDQIASMFAEAALASPTKTIPTNVIFEIRFFPLIRACM